MCRSKSIAAINKELQERFDALFKEDYAYSPIYVENGYQHLESPIITSEFPATIQCATWGLIPGGVKDLNKAKDLSNGNLNARSETVFDKYSFKRSIMSKRCLVPVTGFFETMHFQKQTYPYHIAIKTNPIYCLGGIYSHWRDPVSDETKITYSILTVPANETMKRIHNYGENKHRMPLILEPKDELYWLDLTLNKEGVIDLMKTCDDELLKTYPVNREVNQPTPRNLPEDLKPREYPELIFLDL